MMKSLLPFVDLSIPGLSQRDLAPKPAAGIFRRQLRRDLGRLDTRTLRDIGLDLNAA